MPILRFTVLILLLIAPLITSQANFSTSCNNGDLYECSTSLCANYAWANGTCRINLTSTCQPRSTVYDGAECVQCAGLSQSNCTAFCPDYYYAPSTKLCTPCWVTFGPYCVGCTSTACTDCSYSSHLVVASNGSKCVIAQCSDRNCISCYNYTNQSRCQTCKTGYKVNALYGCSAVSCTIPYCRACQDVTTCKSCVTDYVLSADKQHCYPSCPQAQCLSCCQPGVCQKCIYGYNLVNGTCVVDCSKSVVAHCATCHDLCTCTGCIPNYSLIFYGALCIPNCNDVNCEFCSAPDHCVACSVGYFLNQNGTCVQNTCPVQYCQICLNLQQCLQCQENYTLSVDNLTCIPTCALNITNCVYCFDAYTCAVCAAGYNLTNGTCSLVCNVSDCAVCATSTTCAICRANFTLSADKQTCSPVINIPNCVNGSGDGSCFRCKPGYTKVTYKGRDYCVILCGPGQINAGTIIAPICLVCGQEIENCQSCASNGNGSLICLSCAPGYFVDSAGYCSLCSEYNDNCWTCRGPNNCTACYAGYVLINGQCVSYQCDESVGNCLMCRAGNPYYCQTCLSGFTADGNGSCYVGCPPSYCFDARTQKCVCQHGTYDAKGKCNPCADSNCYTCTISGCLVCNQGYYLSGGTCQPCPPHCATCVSSDTCERCMDGFGLGLNYTCVSVGNGQCVGVSTTGQYFNCPPCCAQCTISSTGQIVCMEASPGCSIVGGTLITCDASCKTCSGTTNRSCTSCYPGQFLIGGECRNCSDPYATACLSTNRSFSTDCIPGYTATFCLGQVGGVCRPCAPNCIQCDAAGPGNCDKCQVGYVILVGTTNCTECAGGQPTCSPYNPVSLVNCVDGQYPNGQGGCSPCPTNCTTCESQTNCTDCIAGYALIDGVCYAIPAHCTGLNPDLTCSGCLSNYTLSADKKSCVYQQSCNATQSCAVCPTGFYLYKGCCYKCSLLTNCVQCGKTGCSKCANGYYLSNGQCLPCGSNCVICTSANVCVTAKPGHCVPTASTGKPSGVVIKCDKSCATCSSYKVCITCAKGYTRKGSECVKTKRASVKIVMKGNGKKNSIFKPKQSKLDTLFNGLSSINRIKNSICSNLPAIFNISSYSVCASILKIEYCATGSFIVGLWLPIDMYDNANDAKNAIGEAFQTGKPLDGAQIISSDVIIQGYEDTPVDPTTPANPTNWGLILGLSIPLATLLIVIVAIMVVRRKQQPVTAERTAGESCENLQKRGEQKL